jgi:hypothetical protein
MTNSPCDHCGQPWAHGFEGPPVRRHTGRVIVLAVLGGVAQALLIVLAAYLSLGLNVSRPVFTVISVGPDAAPLRPALQACTSFDRWRASANSSPSLLNRAVGDANSPRVPWRLKSRLRADLSGLRREVQQGAFAHSRVKTDSYVHAIQADCAPTLAAWRHLWHERRRHGMPPGRSARARPPHS